MKKLLTVGIVLLLTVFVGAQEYDTLFFDGFESGDLSAWSNLPAPVQWHITDSRYAIDGNSWWSGNERLGGYDNYWMHLLVTPEIELPASPTGDLVLSASVNIRVENPPDSPYPLVIAPGETIWIDGWDGAQIRITTDEGTTWQILQPEGGYPYHMMFSFLFNEGDTSLAAGWGGEFNGNVTFDLSPYAGQTVKIAFVMASDAAVSTTYDTTLFGFVVDNIFVTDDADTYFAENADEYSNEMDTLNFSRVMDQPDVTNMLAYEGTYSAYAQNVYYETYQLTTPVIHIPDDFLGTVSYMIYRDAPDYNGDDDDYLDDFYVVYVSTDYGATWNPLAYDWYQGVFDPTWMHCERENGFVGSPTGVPGLYLYNYRGEDIMIRFLFIFDGDDDGGAGTGFYVDNVAIYGTHSYDHDAGVKEILTGPVNLGESVTLNFGVTSYGFETANPELHYVIYDSATGTEIASDDLGSVDVDLLEERFLSTTWTPDEPGTFNIVAWTVYSEDENNSNDTAMITLHVDENMLELGYDDGVADSFEVRFGDGTTGYGYFLPRGTEGDVNYYDGTAVLLSAPTTGYCLTGLSFRGVGVGDVAFKLFEYDTLADMINGSPFAEYEFSLPEDFPFSFPGEWISFTVDDSVPLPKYFAVMVCAANESSYVSVCGDIEGYGTDDYTYFSEYDPTFGFYTHSNHVYAILDTVVPMIRCKATRSAGIEEKDIATLPAKPVLLTNTPNPFNPATEIKFELPASQTVRLEVVDINGKVVRTLVNGDLDSGIHSVRWDGKDTNGNDMPSGIYFYRLITEKGSVSRKMMLVR